MKDELNRIIAGNSVPVDLMITYDDMHGLWGGSIINVYGDGSVERQTKKMGATAAEVTRRQVDGRALIELVRLLLELEAWEQRTAEEQPVAGESRAHLTISVKGSASRVWERVNEMAANDRLIRIKNRVDNL